MDEVMFSVDNALLPFTWHWEGETLVLLPKGPRRGRRILVVGFASTGPDLFMSWLKSRFGGHGMWGCIELAANGYEVLLPRMRMRNPRSPGRLISDLGIAMGSACNLSRNDIVYCNHNIMLWVPFLRFIRRVRAKIVGLLFAREPLPMSWAYDGVIGMTRVATEHGKRIAQSETCAYSVGCGAHRTSSLLLPIRPQVGAFMRRYRARSRDGAEGISRPGLPLKICARSEVRYSV